MPAQAFLPPLRLRFETASREVLRFRHERLGFDRWMVTRTEGEDRIVLQMRDSGYDFEANSVFRRADLSVLKWSQVEAPVSLLAPAMCLPIPRSPFCD